MFHTSFSSLLEVVSHTFLDDLYIISTFSLLYFSIYFNIMSKKCPGGFPAGIFSPLFSFALLNTNPSCSVIPLQIRPVSFPRSHIPDTAGRILPVHIWDYMLSNRILSLS